MPALTALRFPALALLSLLAACAGRSARPLRTVSRVDLHRYAGHWYEIARLPNWFQRAGSHATADYTVGQADAVRVVNTEYRADGRTKEVVGQATATPRSEGSRLRVKFTGLAALAPVPREGNYWIIALAPDYSAALVGTPDRKFLWLLARRPDFPTGLRTHYLELARGEGFDTGRILLADWPR